MNSFWSRPATTTVLLAVIAILLLVQVIQFGTRKMPEPQQMTSMGNPHAGMRPAAAPAAPAAQAPSGHEDFDATAMVLASMKCPGDPVMTLDIPACSGSAAEDRRAMVRELTKVDRPFREIFDAIVAKFGEPSLTDEAVQIRRSARMKP